MDQLIQAATHGDILKLTAPECILVVTALTVLTVSFAFAGRMELLRLSRTLSWLSVLGLSLASGVLLFNQPAGDVQGGLFYSNDACRLVKLGIAVLGIASIWLHMGNRHPFRHQGEFHALLLFSLVGMFLLVGANHLLMIFVALELTALSLYVLTGFEKNKPIATQTALKYFLIGGVSAAFVLYGFSLIFGVTGYLSLPDIQGALDGSSMDPLLMIGLVMALIGFGFKIAAAPFHMWAPDVYQVAPMPVATLIASASKVAGFFVLGRFLWGGFEGAEGSVHGWHWDSGWMVILGLLACLSMVVGNLAALKQTNLRRLLAYSAVAHSGYALLGIMSSPSTGNASAAFYMITYGISIVGVFGLLHVLEQNGNSSDWNALEGLRHRSPWMAASLMVLILSMAGIPPLIGFLAKFNLFISALKSTGNPLGLILLVALALGASAVSLYYYLGILKAAFCKDTTNSETLQVNGYQLTLIGVTTTLVLLLGILPGSILTRFMEAFAS